MKFPREFLDKLKQEVDLLDLVSEYTELQKAGPYLYMGHCPHPKHRDSDASFRVNTQTNTWCCFGCHSDKKNKEQGNYGSDCIAFIEWINDGKLSWIDSVKYLANKINLPLPVEKFDKQYNTNYKLMTKYARNLTDDAYDYLYSRGISNEEIEKWNIGYDSYDDRIVFPLLDTYNNVLGFNKRLITKETKGVSRKYIHSSDSEIFKKSTYLYGLNHLDLSCDYIILSEGVMDCILAQKYGLKNVICALGTSLSQHQIDLLAKYNKQLIVVYDSDKKGIDTMNKVMPILSDNGIAAKLVLLPSNKDLADMSLELKYNIKHYIINNSMTYSYYIMKNAIDDFNKDLYDLYSKYSVIFNEVLDQVPLLEKPIAKAFIEDNVYNKEMKYNALQ